MKQQIPVRITSPLNCLHRPRTIANPMPLFEPVTYRQQQIAVMTVMPASVADDTIIISMRHMMVLLLKYILSVCLSVHHTSEPCLNSSIYQKMFCTI